MQDVKTSSAGDASPVDADKKKLANRCTNPACRYTWSFGLVGSGTLLEIKCPKCKTVFKVASV